VTQTVNDTVTSTDPEAGPSAAPEADRPPAGEQVAPPKSISQVLLDMVRSLGVVAVIVAITLLFVPNLLHPGKSSRVQPVDYSEDAVGFRQLAGVPAYAPVGLPSGWYANGASLPHNRAMVHLHIGFVTPDKNYAGLEESDGPAAAFIASVLGTRGATVSGQVNEGGRAWAVRTSSAGERSITTTDGNVTIVITGSASAAQQQQLARALRPDTGAIS